MHNLEGLCGWDSEGIRETHFGKGELPQRYTQREVSRILGVNRGRLAYWGRLRLVDPESRWGERFYNFSDLVTLRSIKNITDHHIPARKLLRAITALQRDGETIRAAMEEFCFFSSGGEVAAILPGTGAHAVEPLTGQLVLPFHADRTSKIRQMDNRAADQLFEYAVRCEGRPGGTDEAVRIYQQVSQMEPRWSEPHINTGCIYYQRGEMQNAHAAFRVALELDPHNVTAHFNLGCVLDEMGRLDEAVEHLRQATELDPEHADAHFNLASAYEKKGEKKLALQHWILYLRWQPTGPWADFARTQLKKSQSPEKPHPPIPFRRG